MSQQRLSTSLCQSFSLWLGEHYVHPDLSFRVYLCVPCLSKLFPLRLVCNTGKYQSPTVALIAQGMLSAGGRAVDMFPLSLVDCLQEIFRMKELIKWMFQFHDCQSLTATADYGRQLLFLHWLTACQLL